MWLKPGASHYEPISWEDAFSMIGRELNALPSPNEAVFYTSGKTSNEAAFLYQLFARQFGTNNLPDCSNMCHESSGWALRETLGTGKSTVTLEDLEGTDCIVVIGQNPGTNHPRMLSSLQAAKRRGAKILAINPLREVGLLRFKHPQELLHLLGSGTELADQYLQVRINGDVALLKGIMKAMLEQEAAAPGTIVDSAFIRQYCSGFEELTRHLGSEEWGLIVEQSGLSHTEIHGAASMLSKAKTTVVCWAMGLTQHKNAVDNIREIVNLLLLRGNIGKPNAGALCVRGHSNVQGDRTMGIWEQMEDSFLDALGREFNLEPPRQHGWSTVESIQAMRAGKVGVFVSLGGNFLSASPDTHRVAEGLRNCKLTVVISTKLNRTHLVTGNAALILPCVSRTEKDIQASGPQFTTVENTVSFVSASTGQFDPASAMLRSEIAIISGIAQSTLQHRSSVDWAGFTANYDGIRDSIARVVPGFEDFNRRVRAGGFYAPVPPKDRVFPTKTGKAMFTVNAIRPVALEPDQLLLMTIRTHDQFNTVIYGLDDRYRGVFGGRRIVFMNADDMQEAGFVTKQLVDITSHFEGVQRTVRGFQVISYDIPRRSAAAYYPETNPLVPLENFADVSQTPASKSIVVTFQASANNVS
jgi:molybdopterin-dependent oxidoreductase alpha subunit